MITISIEYCVFIVISISYCTFGFYWANRSILCWFVSHFSPAALTIVKFDHFEESFYEFLPFVKNLFYVNCWIIWLRIDGCYLCIYVLEKWEILVLVKRKFHYVYINFKHYCTKFRVCFSIWKAGNHNHSEMFARKSSTWFQFLQILETEDFIFYSFSLNCLVWWNISRGEMCFTCCVRLQKVVIYLVVFAKIMVNAFTSESENHGEMWRTENHFPLEPFSSSTANALHKYATLMRFLSLYCLEDWAEDWLPLWQNNLFHCYLKYIQCVIIDW